MPDIETDYWEVQSERCPKPIEEVREIELEGRKFKNGASLEENMETMLKKTLSHNIDTFAWSAADMPDIDPDFLCHHLTIETSVKSVVQKRRNFNEEKHLVMKEET